MAVVAEDGGDVGVLWGVAAVGVVGAVAAFGPTLGLAMAGGDGGGGGGVGSLFSPNSVIAPSSFGQGGDVPQPVQCPVLLGAAGVDLGVPVLGEQDPTVRVHEAARVPRYGRAVLAAHGPIEGARRRAAERLVGRDIAEVTVEEGDLRDEAAGVRHKGAQGRHCRGRALWYE